MKLKPFYLLLILIYYISFCYISKSLISLSENYSRTYVASSMLNDTMIKIYKLDQYKEDLDFTLSYQSSYSKNFVGILNSIIIGYTKPKNTIGWGLIIGYKHKKQNKMNAIQPKLKTEKPAEYKIIDGKLIKQ